MLDYEPEEFLALPSAAFVHPDDYERVMALQGGLQALGAHAADVHRLRHKRGHDVWVETVFRLVQDGDGQPIMLAAIRDVTERQRQAEELRSAKEAAERANQAKTDFLASMSHEIRTPLNGVLGYADLLMDDTELTNGQRRGLERIQNAGAALFTVVNDILDFAKIEAGKMDLNPRPFSLERLIGGTVSIVEGLAEKKGLRLSVVPDPQTPRALIGDEHRLKQILLNLLNNAVKFTRQGVVTLTVSCEPRSEGAWRVRFAVSDTGIGIPETLQSRLFERFSQVDGSISKEFGGTGLGLAICKRLVELMGGTIGVQSRLGEGSTFWFVLDLPAILDETAPAAPPHPAAPPTPRTGRILLAEDLEINQEIARSVLEAAGHTVDIVDNGAEAVRAVQEKGYDLVLMDIQMPGMDGVEATRAIRALAGACRAVPIVAITANVLPQQVAAFRQAGMNDHVAKPFQRRELQRVVQDWLSRKTVRLVPAEPPQPGDPDVLCRTTFETLLDLLGREKVGRLLARLKDQIENSSLNEDEPAADAAALAQQAHALASASGLLGFQDLSARCAALEAAYGQDGDAGHREAVRAAAQRTLDTLKDLGVAA